MPKKIITLDELSRYDEKIKDYIGTNECNVHRLSAGEGLSTSNPIILENISTGMYFFNDNSNLSLSVYIKSSNSKSSATLFSELSSGCYINYFKDIESAQNNEIVAYIFSIIVTNSTTVKNKIMSVKKSTTSTTGVTSSTTIRAIEAVTLSSDQVIASKKTFTVLPESSIVPITDNQLVNKAYVDETAAPIQVSALPSADSSNLNKIYQYIGATNSIYTNGYFYKCLYDGDDYYWESIPVQANVVNTTGAQTITGVKTFNALPQSSVVPTTNNQLVNKKYVDDNLPLDSKMVYVGKISEYDTAAKALDVANYPIGTRIILKHDGAKHTVFIKNTNRDTNAIEVELGDGTAGYVPIDNIYYFDRNNEGTTAVTSTRAFYHGPVVTEWKQVKHPENDVPYIAASGQELIVRAPFRIEEDNSGNLNTSTLSDFIKIQEAGIQKTTPQQRMDIMYIDKDKNKYNMVIVEYTSSVNKVLEGTCISTRPLADGYYHNLKVQLIITIDSTTSEYSSHTKTITDLGPIIQTQFTTMPTASSSTVGKIVQYTGTTDSNYTNGYFYIGVTDGESTPTYSWNNISTQETQITKATDSDIDSLFE